MITVKLHLDADISRRSLRKGLLDAGIDVTWAPNEWISSDASDQMQLAEATLRERCLVTHNIADFYRLHNEQPEHYGIILVHQKGWKSGEILNALIKLAKTTSLDEIKNQIRWLNEWRVL